MGRPKLIGPGVVGWRNDGKDENGAVNLVIHYTADPERRTKEWPLQESRMLGGTNSVQWRQEQEVDFEVEDGILTYFAFNRARNCVSRFAIPEDWPKWVSVDFGGTVPTAVLFFAQNPKTQQVVVWSEVYRAQVPTLEIKLEVYQKAADYARCSLGELRWDGIFEDGVGDPARRQDIIDWGFEPWPIPLRGNPGKGGQPINRRKAGENRVNDWFAPSFSCCGARWIIRDLHSTGQCLKCKRVHDGAPLLVIFEDNCPQLVRTIPLVVRKDIATVSREELQTEDNVKGVEDHAPDALRYGCMARLIEAIEEGVPTSLVETPSHRLDHARLLDKFRQSAIERSAYMKAELDRELAGDQDAVSTADPMRLIEERLGIVSSPWAEELGDLYAPVH